MAEHSNSHPHPQPASGRPNDNALGAVFLVLSVLFFTVEAAVARSLGDKVPLAFLLVTRSLSQLLLPMPWLLRIGLGNVLTTPGRTLQLARGCLTIVSFSTFYYAAARLPLTLTTVITFSSVLWIALLAAPLLHERVGAARWASVLVGFGGILLAVRPSLQAGSGAILSALVAALAMALIVLLVRRLTASERPEVIMFYSGLCTSIAFVPFAIAAWRPIAPEHAWQLLLIVPCGPLAQWFQFKAYRVAEASAVAPVQYVRYLLAILIGWFVFDELPDRWNVAGAALVVGAALWLTWHESRRARRLIASSS
jgi:drug/metabolite transporter (DMT)-like permease